MSKTPDASASAPFTKGGNIKHEIIKTLKDFHTEFGIFPTQRVLLKKLQEKNININSIELVKLFGQAPINEIAKLAGLPNPKKCDKF